jgi:threonyl-tRNA synthetase
MGGLMVCLGGLGVYLDPSFVIRGCEMSDGKLKLEFPDGSVREFEHGVTGLEVAESIGAGLARAAVVCRVDGELRGLSESIEADALFEIFTFDSADGRDVFRHSASHILAAAVKRVRPEAKLAIGPPIENGFYYDFDVDVPFTEEDLAAFTAEMKKIVKENEPFERTEVSKEVARRKFEDAGEPYKVELLDDIEDGEAVTLYRTGDFVDLCRGPHVPSAKRIKSFKLLSVAGAYWRGSEKNRMLQRIYATAFPDKKQLNGHIEMLAEAERRDHRRLGKELDLFSFHEDLGSGLVLWHPKGSRIRTVIEDFWRAEHERGGYDLLYTPHIAKRSLWELSGHLDFYGENMYAPMPIDEIDYQLKPMNCPFHMLIYKSRARSYRELPLRWAELGTVYRYERSGALHGLLRVRGFTQDDAHILCRPDQLDAEITRVVEFSLFILRTFGFSEFEVYLSTRPEKYVGTLDSWDQATKALENALKTIDLDYEVDPGEGVFYGPKIDIKIKDSLGRAWQCSTIQVDFQEPERFEIEYTGSDGNAHQPIMIHRALMGSLERFFGCLVEHYAGAFPTWLAPVQVAMLPISDDQHEYAETLAGTLRGQGLRVTVDSSNTKIGHKIRSAQLEQIPYMLVLGVREVDEKKVAVRHRRLGDLGSMSIDEFIGRISEETSQRAMESVFKED